jgi:protein-tyrosine phosphatase
VSGERPQIDTHVHLLPGIDDGPATLDESVDLARLLVEDRVGTAVATPHVRPDHPGVVPAELSGRCSALEEELQRAGVPLEVVAGGEVDLIWAGEASDEDLRLTTYGQRGRFVLVETPYSPLPRHFEQVLFELQMRVPGILLAHPERNPTFQQDPRRLDELVDGGILLQITASSLVTGGSGSGRSARDLVKRRRAHVIASDAHGAERVARSPLAAGVEVAARLAPERAEWMVVDAPAAVLAGRTPKPPEPPPRRGRLARALGFG